MPIQHKCHSVNIESLQTPEEETSRRIFCYSQPRPVTAKGAVHIYLPAACYPPTICYHQTDSRKAVCLLYRPHHHHYRRRRQHSSARTTGRRLLGRCSHIPPPEHRFVVFVLPAWAALVVALWIYVYLLLSSPPLLPPPPLLLLAQNASCSKKCATTHRYDLETHSLLSPGRSWGRGLSYELTWLKQYDGMQVEYSCGHFRFRVQRWCSHYERTQRRCQPNITTGELR